MSLPRNGENASSSRSYASVDDAELSSVLEVFRAACAHESPESLLPAITRAVSRLAGGASTALLIREGGALSLVGGAELTHSARNALGALADPDLPLTARALQSPADTPLRLGFRGSEWSLYSLWGERAAHPVGAIVVQTRTTGEDGKPDDAGALAFLPQLARDLAPVITGALRRRDLDDEVDRLASKLEDRERDIGAGQQIIDELVRRIVALERMEGHRSDDFSSGDLDSPTMPMGRGPGGRPASSVRFVQESSESSADPVTDIVALRGGFSQSSG